MGGSAETPLPRAVLATLLLLLATFAFHAVRFGHYVNDDAYITFRYSRSLATGNGPYFNPGEHVEGYTNPLLMVLLAVVYRIGGAGALPGAAKGIGIMAGGACVAVAFALSRRLGTALDLPSGWSDAAGLFAAAVVAASPGFAVNSVSGLETVPFALLIASGALAGLTSIQGQWRGSGLLFAAAYLMRPDGVVAFALFWVALAAAGSSRRERRMIRPLLLDAAVVTLVVGIHLTTRYVLYDHEWLPNTYYAKLGGDSERTGWQYVLDGAALPFAGWALLLLGLAGLARTRGRAWTVVAPVLALAAGGTLLPAALGADWMAGYRFLIHYLPVLAAVFGAGLAALGAVLPTRSRAAPLAAVLAVLALCWFGQGGIRRALWEATRLRAIGYETGHRALASWLQTHARPGETVALMDVGIVGYDCPDLRILDLTGLTDQTIGKSPGTFLSKRYDPQYVLGRRPEYIVLVLVAPGQSYAPPPRPLRLKPFTSGEASVSRDPEFLARYARPRPAPERGNWQEGEAARIGAERIFEHGHPGQYYLLALYRRHEPT
jgi:arabinofuranosyltransferase